MPSHSLQTQETLSLRPQYNPLCASWVSLQSFKHFKTNCSAWICLFFVFCSPPPLLFKAPSKFASRFYLIPCFLSCVTSHHQDMSKQTDLWFLFLSALFTAGNQNWASFISKWILSGPGSFTDWVFQQESGFIDCTADSLRPCNLAWFSALDSNKYLCSRSREKELPNFKLTAQTACSRDLSFLQSPYLRQEEKSIYSITKNRVYISFSLNQRKCKSNTF